MEYVSNVPNLQTLKILNDAWEDEALEAQGKKKSSYSSDAREKAVAIDPVRMPNVWDGEKEGTTANAEMFNRMLLGTR